MEVDEMRVKEAEDGIDRRTIAQVKVDGQKEAVHDYINDKLRLAKKCLDLMNTQTFEDYTKSVAAARKYLVFADKGLEELQKLEASE
jgi:hypothetical protein